MAENTLKGGITATVGMGRLPGRVKTGSVSFHRKSSTQSARASMSDIVAKYNAIVQQLKGVTPQAIRDALQPVLDKSKIYVPKDTGALRSTGMIRVTEEGRTVVGNINYGGPNAPYAAIVHERMDLHHVSPTRAKFLQAAMEEEYPSFLITLATSYANAAK